MFDPVYLIFIAPGLLLALYASFKTKSTFAKYSRVASSRGITGACAAEKLMAAAGIRDVRVEKVSGFLSDHYDPITHTLRLSPSVYQGDSLSSVGVACHEAGHAIQHAQGFMWMQLRTAMVPVTNVGSWLSYIIIMLGFVLSSTSFIFFGAVLFSAAVVFSIVTLPVEYDASRRAKSMMLKAGVVSSIQEASMAGRVLDAAFLTYVAAAVSSLLTLFYYLMRAGVFGRRSD